MAGLFDFENFDLGKAITQPFRQISHDAELVGDILQGEEGAFSQHQKAMTKEQSYLGLNPDNKIVKNSDAIVGSVFAAMFAGPAVMGAMGSGGSAAAGMGSSAMSSMGSIAAPAGGAGVSTGGLGSMAMGSTSLGSTAATAGTTAPATQGFWSNMAMNAAGSAAKALMTPTPTQKRSAGQFAGRGPQIAASEFGALFNKYK